MEEKPTFFRTPADFRKWLRKNCATAQELWVGFYKVGSSKPSITWPESVDEALCVGWIDGIRKTIDDESYKIRFTPRKKISTWSAVNIRRVKVLTDEKRMQPAGLKAFEAKRENRSGIYAYEQRPQRVRRALPRPDEEGQGGVDVLPGSVAVLPPDTDLVRGERQAGRDAPEAAEETDRGVRCRAAVGLTCCLIEITAVENYVVESSPP